MAAWCHPPPPLAPPPGLVRVDLLLLALALAPTTPASLRPLAGCLEVDHLAPAPPPSQGPVCAKRPSPPCPTSSIVLVVVTAGAAQRPCSCFCRRGLGTSAQHPEHGTKC